MSEYSRILGEFYRTVWAILPEKHAAIKAFLHAKAAGERVPEIQAAPPRKAQVVTGTAGSVAVLPVFGVIAKRMNMLLEISGGTSTDLFLRDFRAALADNDVRAIVLDVDSPGGAVQGTPETWEEIYKSRGVKPIVAQFNPEAASAAYYIACAADELVVTPSGGAGAIGCLAEFDYIGRALEAQGIEVSVIVSEVSPKKAEFAPYFPLSDEARAELQRMVDLEGERFVDAVAKSRKLSAKRVLADFGQGRMREAKAALAAGMVDRIGTLEDTLARLLGKSTGKRSGLRTEALVPDSVACRRCHSEGDGLQEFARAEDHPAETAAPDHLNDLRLRELALRRVEAGG